MDTVLNLLPILFYYGWLCIVDYWYIDHNDLHFKEINANKFITPISYHKQKKRGRYRKIELFFPILEIYAHLVLIAGIVNLCLDGDFSKYLYFVSFIIFGLILIVYHTICWIKRKKK